MSPAKGSVERGALEQKSRALAVWSEVAMLEPFALEKAVAEGKWESAVLDRIKTYRNTQIRYTQTLKADV